MSQKKILNDKDIQQVDVKASMVEEQLSSPHKTVSFDFLFSNCPKFLGGHIYTNQISPAILRLWKQLQVLI